ncbi:hypothetical protein BY458DRAFT_215323 [Sporodiniella umbellata]|nr:hypothetical protein BY458DRAFT_215323 [Sporodiniella umbellata]
MSPSEIVYTVHKFVAENVDEISLNVGEKVLVVEKDEGYNDGWWKGRNEKGDLGLFPISYTVSKPPANVLEQEMNRIRISTDGRMGKRNSVLPKHVSSLSSKNIQSIVKQSLNSPLLKQKAVEEWNSKEVEIWLTEMGFDDNLAKNFKDQEITGDILLELTLDSLKELQIDTFGKRFKVHSAITKLKNETKYPSSFEPSAELSKKPYYNSFSDDDDLNSTYSASTRNSRLPSIRNESRTSIHLQRLPPIPHIVRKPSQMSTASAFRWNQTQSILDEKANQEQPDKRYTLDTHENSSKYSFMRSSFLHPNKLQSILPSTNTMNRRSEDVPTHHEPSSVPDMEGWLYKQGDRYKNWNKRWFVLKSSNLFYFKSPKAIRMKGIINLKGYRIEVDSSLHTGKYCFKMHHEKERTFYFYTDHEKYMKDWLKALIKATIERDFSTPVLSSNTIPTMSLEAARRKQPRPPSTLFLEQKNRSSSISHSYPHYDCSLTPMKEHPEEQILQQSFSSPVMSVSRAPSLIDNSSGFSFERRRLKDSGYNSTPSRSLTQSSNSTKASGKVTHAFYPTEEDEDLIDPESIHERHNCMSEEENESILSYQPTFDQHELLAKKKQYIDWVNLYAHSQIHDLSELSTGEVLLDLLEHLSKKKIKRNPINQNQSVYSQMMDCMITAFEHMHKEGVPLKNGYTFRDVLNGREAKIMNLLDDIKAWYDNSCTVKEKKDLI